jgi:GT2 family glycosyltransferase
MAARDDSDMLLSIVIVSWNTKHLLHDCLVSLQPELQGRQAEIFVVDNGSTDGSPEHVESAFPGVILIRNKDNLGFSKANNLALRRCRGRYICLVNSDIVVLPSCFDGLLTYMDQHPDVGVIGPRILNPDGTIQLSCFGVPNYWNMFCRVFALDTLFPKTRLFGQRMMNYFDHSEVRKVDILNGCFLMVRKEALQETGLLDERFFFYGEDMDWCKRFRDRKWEITFYPESMAVHYGGASTAKSPIKYYIEMHRTDMQFWEKHYGRFGLCYITAMLFLQQHLRLCGMGLLYLFGHSKREEARHKIRRSVASIQWLFHHAGSRSTRGREV